MTNPVLVESTRGSLAECLYRGAYAVVDGDGAIVASAGNIERPMFPRSAIKVFQAIPLIETGAADRFGLSDADLSLACASHSGETGHVARAQAMLARAGLDAAQLECGCHWPFDVPVALALARTGDTPGQLHNNCSGKHAGFLCTAVHENETLDRYVAADHPVQARARQVIEDLTGTDLGADACGTDGCSIPTYAAPLRAFAMGFAKLVSGKAVAEDRARAGRRLIEACMAHPWEMSGTNRACLALMQAAPGRVFAKTGADGVYCGAIPELEFGFALKIDDGATRAAESLAAAIIGQAFASSDPDIARSYDALARTDLKNWEGLTVGEVRPVKPA
ncbi:asparaginase [Fulvimarina sp. 2208YS6-2-32]|uniref:Asparaginase n=1 Tax=Fulvimarina uroteuthidis TaxID=3098149 RepID=A0ABU5I581_9HYPH|nr:asparaginase [Fulvimarina sp. 2208YS6-2-32]MDY8110551.1 asparaginase [Fulvimarina sp. 2208YS6-2-32]